MGRGEDRGGTGHAAARGSEGRGDGPRPPLSCSSAAPLSLLGAQRGAGPADPAAWKFSRVYSFLDYIMGGCQIHFTVSPRSTLCMSSRAHPGRTGVSTPTPQLPKAPPHPGRSSELAWHPGWSWGEKWGQGGPSAGPGGPSPGAEFFLYLFLGSPHYGREPGTLGRDVARAHPQQRHRDGEVQEGRRRGRLTPGTTRATVCGGDFGASWASSCPLLPIFHSSCFIEQPDSSEGVTEQVHGDHSAGLARGGGGMVPAQPQGSS